MEFVGHEIKEGKIGLQSDNVKKIQEAPRPKTKTQVRSFLGLTGYYRNFIPNYANIAMPLTDLTKKGRPNKIVWDKPQEDSFQNLKRQLARLRPRSLRCEDCQEHNGELFPVGFASKKLQSLFQFGPYDDTTYICTVDLLFYRQTISLWLI